MSLNRVFLIGFVGSDPDLKYFESGSTLATFSLATTERFKSKRDGEWAEQVEWHKISCWDGVAQFAIESVKRGVRIMVEGRIKNRRWADKATQKVYHSIEILASNIILLEGVKKEEQEPSIEEIFGEGLPFDNNEIPF
ncbi:MAG: single-stranded DNA-binding protein [Bacteroidales bacterium]